MTGRAGLICVAAVALVFAGCGGTKQAATTAATSPPPSAASQEPPVKSVTYHVTLHSSGAGSGKANRSARAVISIKGETHEICWHFSQFKNLTEPTEPAIEGETRSGFISSPLGTEYKPSGCIEGRPAVLLRFLEKNRDKLYVAIRSRNPRGGRLLGPL